ncbi:MAG: hypothetical protein F6K10_31325 [Moorea sp. SIO2B7]|nr:hypothetical protein [Moorena sp. SIO2B7]
MSQGILKPDLRQQHQSYISEKASAAGYNALASSNWQEVKNLNVANLYYYFKVRENKYT